MGNAAGIDEIRAYWQPGCTSCLRMKEFLTKHKVPFVSRNIVADEGALDELAVFGLRQVPVVIRGDRYADGQVLADVARIAGIAYGSKSILPVAELRSRLDLILEANGRFIKQVPESELVTMLPGRPRSYADLCFHIANIADAFLEHEAGIPLVFDAYNRVPPHGWGQVHLQAYSADVRRRVSAWFDSAGKSRDWLATADVYYGRQTMHEYLERTTWHAGQHTRQLMWVLGEKLGIAPAQPLPADTWADLPMPENVWDPV
jgi:glutaredoxin